MLLRFVSGLWLVLGEVLLESERRPPPPRPLVPDVGKLLPRSSRRSRLELMLFPGETTALRLILQPRVKGGRGMGITGPYRVMVVLSWPHRNHAQKKGTRPPR